MYDYLIVGAGLFGAVFAQQMTEAGKRCLVVEKRQHIAGNIYSESVAGIETHRYGPHIFHTEDEQVWHYVQRFARFNNFVYAPVANYQGNLYNLPFNMNTFHALWGVNTPTEAQAVIARQRAEVAVGEPQNLEEQALSLVGRDIYEKLIKGYTEKQWGRPCRELPAFIIKRLPVRLTFDNNYFNHPHQGIPVEGYTAMVEAMLSRIEVRLGIDYLQEREALEMELAPGGKIVFTGPLDEFFGYRLGALEYRSLRFETEVLDVPNYQGVAGMNFTEAAVPYTRIVEHKHFTFDAGNIEQTVITREYSATWSQGQEPYYPVNDTRNQLLLSKYQELAVREPNIIFGGRLGLYRYLNMDQVIGLALKEVGKEMERKRN